MAAIVSTRILRLQAISPRVSAGATSRRKTVSIPGSLVAFTGTIPWIPGSNVTLKSVWVAMGNAPTDYTGAVFNLRKNGVAIFTGTKPTVAQGAYLSTPLAISVSMIANTDQLTPDVELPGGGANAAIFIDYEE